MVKAPLYSVLATARLRVKAADGNFKEIRMICDSGAQANLMAEATLKELGIVGQPKRTNIIGIDEVSIHTKGEVELDLYHRLVDRQIRSGRFVIVDNFQLNHPQASFSHMKFPGIQSDELADPQYNMRGRVDGIIGVELLSTELLPGIQRNVFDLLAQDTRLGWIIFGGPSADNDATNEKPADELKAVNLVTAGELYQQIRKLWEIDDMSDSPVMSGDDTACEALYKSRLVRKGTLLMTPDAELGESRAMARRRLYCLENRFVKDAELKKAYTKFMDEYEQLGHMRRAEPLQQGAQHYYIPHSAVSIDRKFRVVFDASAKTTNGRLLNDTQYVGARLQKDLVDIIMKFRTGRIAVTADICKMFRQIEVQPEFWDLQRILWRKSRQEPIGEYWLTVVTYGMVSSPYNAVRTLQQCARDNASEYPSAARTVEKDFYMDDLLASVETEAAAITLRGSAIHCF